MSDGWESELVARTAISQPNSTQHWPTYKRQTDLYTNNSSSSTIVNTVNSCLPCSLCSLLACPLSQTLLSFPQLSCLLCLLYSLLACPPFLSFPFFSFLFFSHLVLLPPDGLLGKGHRGQLPQGGLLGLVRTVHHCIVLRCGVQNYLGGGREGGRAYRRANAFRRSICVSVRRCCWC